MRRGLNVPRYVGGTVEIRQDSMNYGMLSHDVHVWKFPVNGCAVAAAAAVARFVRCVVVLCGNWSRLCDGSLADGPRGRDI